MTELTNIKKLAENSLSEPILLNENLIIKMCYSYSVTLLEAFLGDTIKALISENNVYLNNALERVDQIRNTKYSLFDLSKSGNGFKWVGN